MLLTNSTVSPLETVILLGCSWVGRGGGKESGIVARQPMRLLLVFRSVRLRSSPKKLK